jgi:hypothetical protein
LIGSSREIVIGHALPAHGGLNAEDAEHVTGEVLPMNFSVLPEDPNVLS